MSPMPVNSAEMFRAKLKEARDKEKHRRDKLKKVSFAPGTDRDPGDTAGPVDPVSRRLEELFWRPHDLRLPPRPCGGGNASRERRMAALRERDEGEGDSLSAPSPPPEATVVLTHPGWGPPKSRADREEMEAIKRHVVR